MSILLISAFLGFLSPTQASATEATGLKIELAECHVDAPDRQSHLGRLFPNMVVLSEEYFLSLTKDGENSNRRFISLDLRQREVSTNSAMTDVSFDFEPVFSIEVSGNDNTKFSFTARDLIVDFLPQVFPVPSVTGTAGPATLRSKVSPNNPEITYPDQIQFSECLYF